MDEPDYGKGPLDRLRDVFIKALQEVEDPFLYDSLIQEWNEAVEYCQKVLEVKYGRMDKR